MIILYAITFALFAMWASRRFGLRPSMRRHPILSVLVLALLFAASLRGGTKGTNAPPASAGLKIIAVYDLKSFRWIPVGAPVRSVQTNIVEEGSP